MATTLLDCGRTFAFVDGLNVFHALSDNHLGNMKWLNLWALCERVLKELVVSEASALVGVKWCTAYYYREGTEGLQRHKDYEEALQTVGVEAVRGHFKRNKRVRCKRCSETFTVSEEKQTDVNIAALCVAGALSDEFDTAMLVTGDTDLLPVFRILKTYCPDKKIVVAFPPGRGRNPRSVRERAARSRKIELGWLADCQLPNPVKRADGSEIERPPKWA